jgi:hypothetical protein
MNLENNPYISKNPLTPTESIFYQRLLEALPDYTVLAQVQLSSIIKVDESKIFSNEYYRWFNPIAHIISSQIKVTCSLPVTLI